MGKTSHSNTQPSPDGDITTNISLTAAKIPALFSKRRYLKAFCSIIFFVGLWLLVSYLFFRRFPNNYRQPNFFGEEGYIFSKNIIHHGFWRALLTTFNGYYIWGLYILEKISFVINDLFYGG